VGDTTITWTVKYLDPRGFEASLTVANSDGRAVLAKADEIIEWLARIGAQPAAAAGNGEPAAPVPAAQLTALAEGEQRMLITKLVRTDETKADLYGRGHRFKDLTLFDLSELGAVGIDFAPLPQGQEHPCRFFAVYRESGKRNKAGNPYKDVVRLEKAE